MVRRSRDDGTDSLNILIAVGGIILLGLCLGAAPCWIFIGVARLAKSEETTRSESERTAGSTPSAVTSPKLDPVKDDPQALLAIYKEMQAIAVQIDTLKGESGLLTREEEAARVKPIREALAALDSKLEPSSASEGSDRALLGSCIHSLHGMVNAIISSSRKVYDQHEDEYARKSVTVRRRIQSKQ